MLALESCQALVLNADYKPLTTAPLSRYSWRKSIEEVLTDKVIVVAEYEREARSANLSIPIPSVVALKRYVDQSRLAPLNRHNLFARDRFQCQYCGAKDCDLTFDHVIPRSKGGVSSFFNLCSSCVGCNSRKADMSLSEARMTPLREPFHPTLAELNAIGRSFPIPRDIDDSWRDWLYWTVPLQA